MFETDTIILYTLIACLFLAFAIEIIHYLFIGTAILRFKHKETKNRSLTSDETDTTARPGVSVIIYARYDEENIRNYLPLVLEQQYPNYEVILVNDGSDEETALAVLDLQKNYPHLYLTHIPDETRIISHKKLALTIGIKAAKNDILIFTDTDCRPWTPHWIEEIVRSYTPETDFVLGYSAYQQYKTSFVSKLVAYDALTTAMKYMGIAAHIKPYMGVGRNMSYRKSFFIANKGFAGYLHIESGDDDLFVNHFATRKNTAVQPSLAAKTITMPKPSFSNWYFQKLHFLLHTSTNYTAQSRHIISIEPLVRWVFWIASALLLSLFHTSMYVVIATVTAILLKLLIQTIIINRTARSYKETVFNPILILLYDIFLPIVNLYIVSIGRLTNKKVQPR